MARKATTNSAIVLLIGALLTVVAVGVIISSCQEDVGIADPSAGTVRMIAQLNEAHAILEEGESYSAYSSAFRVAYASYDDMALHNAADTKLRSQLSGTIDCMSIARDAWQAEEEGEWSAEIYGSAAYWSERYPGTNLELGDGELAFEEVIAAARECAEQGLAEATSMSAE
jgi:hypothetical protein